MNLDSQIEAILFFKGEPVSIKKLSELTERSDSDVRDALIDLKLDLEERGICLIEKENDVMLGTAKDAGELIEKIVKEELSKDIGKAGLETLTIILYKGTVSRRDIDNIRGVNSNFILRNLLIRGLVEKITDPKDHRAFLYKPTFELLGYLGVSKIEELPNYEAVKKQLNEFEERADKNKETD